MQKSAKLSPVYRAFVGAYTANGYNAAQAYLSIKPDVSYDTARANGSKLLANTDVQQAIQDKIDKAYDKNIASRQYLTQEAHDIGIEARSKGQYNPALTAVDLKAKLNRLYDRDTPDLESYTQVMQQFIQVNVNNVPRGTIDTPQPVDINTDSPVNTPPIICIKSSDSQD